MHDEFNEHNDDDEERIEALSYFIMRPLPACDAVFLR
jgi:hypothetical protein